MTNRDFAYTALRLAAVYLFIIFLSSLPRLDYDFGKEHSGAFLITILYSLATFLLAALFWFKAKLLSAYFALDNVKKSAKAEISDWYNLGCIIFGIVMIIVYGTSLLTRVLELTFDPKMVELLHKEDTTYIWIALISDVIRILIGFLLIFKKEGILNLIHKYRSR